MPWTSPPIPAPSRAEHHPPQHPFIELARQGFEVDYDVVDVHNDRAYVLAAFREVLRPKADGPATEVDGRIVHVWQREANGTWKVTRVLAGRVSPNRIRSWSTPVPVDTQPDV